MREVLGRGGGRSEVDGGGSETPQDCLVSVCVHTDTGRPDLSGRVPTRGVDRGGDERRNER